MGLPFLALPGFVAADAGIAIATASAAMASPKATRRRTLVWSIPFLRSKGSRTSHSTIRMAQHFDNEDFAYQTMRFHKGNRAPWHVLALGVLAAVLLAGCGGEAKHDDRLIVFARAPSTNVFS